MTQLPTLELNVRNLYGTLRYFPADTLSVALCKIRGKKTLLLEDINTLVKAGFPIVITDDKGRQEVL